MFGFMMSDIGGRIRRSLNGKKDVLKPQGCIDYRKYFFSRLMGLDDGFLERGITFRFVFIVIASMASETCSFLTGLKEETIIIEKARNEASNTLNFNIRIFFCYMGTMLFLQPLAESLLGRSWKKLPIPWSIPPSDTDTNFLMVFAFQSIAIVIANCLGMIFMSFSSVTTQMTALFDVLLLSIHHIEDRAAARSEAEGIDFRDAMVACLREDVIFYQDIVRELTTATPYLRNAFMTFSASVPVALACEAYPIIAGKLVLGVLIKSFVFFTILFLCWALTCTRLEAMTDKHEAVFRALYETPWYESSLKFRRMIYLTLVFGTQPRYIKARFSNEITASTATFYSFSVSSFNWMNLMRKMV